MKKAASKLLSVLLALTMLAGLLPGKALAAGEDYQFGTLQYFSKMTKEYTGDTYYYTDQWFQKAPKERNDSLALVSAQLAASVAEDPANSVAFLQKLGFSDAEAVGFVSTKTDDCAYVVGTKIIGKKKLMAVAFQGTNYGDKGWQQNVTVNGSGSYGLDHAAFSAAAKAFVDDYSQQEKKPDILWITGQSRGGAVANLAAAYLLDKENAPAVFGYTFESPATTERKNANADKYKGIQNYLCDDDPVPMLPMWGMTRYGQEIAYSTAAIEAVVKEIGTRNPAAEEAAAEGYDAALFNNDVKGYLEGLVDILTETVPARADYTRVNTASFPVDGKTMTIEYTYQGGLQALCHLILGSDASLTDRLMPLLGELNSLIYGGLEEAYAAARHPKNEAELLRDAAQRRWEAAGLLFKAGADVGAVPPFQQDDLYALLKLLTPFLVKTDGVGDSSWTLPAPDSDELLEYANLDVVLGLVAGSTTLLFSHQPDAILARLRLLAPAPEMEDVALTIPAPEAGDSDKTAPAAVEAAVKGLGWSWLTVKEAKWLSEDASLANNKAYYLSVTLDAVGHTVPAEFAFTINGEKPVEQTVAWESGRALVTGVWKFTLGSPARITVTYDANGHGTPPAPAKTDVGALLGYSLQPADLGTVKDSGGTWRFDGWFDDSGTAWDQLTAGKDVTLRAKWTRLVDEISLTYDIPHVGDSGSGLVALTAPADASYKVIEAMLYDENYNTVTAIASADELILGFEVILTGEDMCFPTREGEDGYLEYSGTLTVNGTALSVDYSDFKNDDGTRDIYLMAEYPFTPLTGGSGHSDKGGFVDVPADSYCADAVKWAVAKGVTQGIDATHFAPNASCTRAQMVTFLWRAAGQPEPETEGVPFADVDRDAYYGKAVRWAVEKGITQGTDKTHFSPNATVNRGQSVTFLYRLLGEKTEEVSPFTDVAADAYYAAAVNWAADSGVTAGKTATRFAPADHCTRGQIVTFLYRAMADT